MSGRADTGNPARNPARNPAGNPAGNPQPARRAQALIAGFLKRHGQAVSAFAQGQRAAPGATPGAAPGATPGAEAGSPDAGPKAFVPRAPPRPRDYPVYAAHFVSHASRLYAALQPAPMDDDAVFGLACEALAEGLGTAPRDAAELMVRALLRTPRTAAGSEFDDAQIRAFSQDELRWLLIADIAQRDAESVLEASRKGAETVDPSDRDIEPLAALLGLPAYSGSYDRAAAAPTERKPD